MKDWRCRSGAQDSKWHWCVYHCSFHCHLFLFGWFWEVDIKKITFRIVHTLHQVDWKEQSQSSKVSHLWFPETSLNPSRHSTVFTFLVLGAPELDQRDWPRSSLMPFIVFTGLMLSPYLVKLTEVICILLSGEERSEGLKGFKDHQSLWKFPPWLWWMLKRQWGRREGMGEKRKKKWHRNKTAKRYIIECDWIVSWVSYVSHCGLQICILCAEIQFLLASAVNATCFWCFR